MPTTTAAKSTISIATSATTPANAAAYAALTWGVIGNVVDIGGTFGDAYNKIEAKVLGTRRVLKAKGSVDAGMIELKVLRDAADAGQNSLRTALGSDDLVYVKIELGDKPSAGASPKGSTVYMGVLVFGAPVTNGDADSFVEQTFNLEVNTQPVEVAPSAT